LPGRSFRRGQRFGESAKASRRKSGNDHCHDRLHRSGWSVGEFSVTTENGPVWMVSGTNGENVIEARGGTQSESWLRAVEQARSLGMLRR
jgi:hypothetical protein